MTIAMCAVVPEGVVLGADSTSSVFYDGKGFHYFNHNQKLFEVGENSTVGIVTWGVGNLKDVSYRTLLARLSDEMVAAPAATVLDLATRWAQLVWDQHRLAFDVELQKLAALAAMVPFDPNLSPLPKGMRNADDEAEHNNLLQNLYVGFCVGGYMLPDRTPVAYEIHVMPNAGAAPVPHQINNISFWGAPNFILRLLNGWDHELKAALLNSGKWSGSEPELQAVLNQSALHVGVATLRDAVDFVYSSIHSTIKALKFSDLNQICGGPIEVAVVSTDRRFRWVRHKKWDSAIVEGDVT